ncbi:MAG: hypothetical protein K5871_06350 [Lachnospiraceae bacterium]|nr:hypothetical protein [Lachnospiraceae bacterium]
MIKDIIANAALGALFIVAGIIGFIAGTMNLLSIILILIGVAVLAAQLRKWITDKKS